MESLINVLLYACSHHEKIQNTSLYIATGEMHEACESVSPPPHENCRVKARAAYPNNDKFLGGTSSQHGCHGKEKNWDDQCITSLSCGSRRRCRVNHGLQLPQYLRLSFYSTADAPRNHTPPPSRASCGNTSHCPRSTSPAYSSYGPPSPSSFEKAPISCADHSTLGITLLAFATAKYTRDVLHCASQRPRPPHAALISQSHI